MDTMQNIKCAQSVRSKTSLVVCFTALITFYMAVFTVLWVMGRSKMLGML